MLSGGFSPVKQGQVNHAVGLDSITKKYQSTSGDPLRFSLNIGSVLSMGGFSLLDFLNHSKSSRRSPLSAPTLSRPQRCSASYSSITPIVPKPSRICGARNRGESGVNRGSTRSRVEVAADIRPRWIRAASLDCGGLLAEEHREGDSSRGAGFRGDPALAAHLATTPQRHLQVGRHRGNLGWRSRTFACRHTVTAFGSPGGISPPREVAGRLGSDTEGRVVRVSSTGTSTMRRLASSPSLRSASVGEASLS